MTAGLNNLQKILAVEHEVIESDSRSGPTTNPESFLAVMNAIAHSMAAACRAQQLSTLEPGVEFVH